MVKTYKNSVPIHQYFRGKTFTPSFWSINHRYFKHTLCVMSRTQNIFEFGNFKTLEIRRE